MEKITDIEAMRHTASHILAKAVKTLFPTTKFGIGPTIEDGFYYDFLFEKNITQEDLAKLEGEMKKIISQDLSVEKSEMSKAEAKKFFKDQPFKLELIDGIEDEKVGIYTIGDFSDLCTGPHVGKTGEVKAFKLLTLAGAYWRGDEKNQMLTRIYGTAFESQKDIDTYIENIEEAKLRDHRKIGKDLDLFHIDDEVGLGLVLWHPKGAKLWHIIEDFWYQEHLKNGYELVRSPHIGNRKLWEKSGHWGYYNSSMYPPLEAGQSLEESQQSKKAEKSEQYLLKPMNCPFHIQIYNNSAHSYRELPFRWAETGTVYRFEKTGELSGLTRVRGFTQDDAHIICREDQVKDELKRVVDFILYMYKAFGFDLESVKVYLSLRDPKNMSKYAGNDAGWDFTEKILREVAIEKKLAFKEEKGEAAFYGPKLDFKIRDVLGREWQCSTLQFDFNNPERFDMKFINSQGEAEKPYMLHRALFGSFERFIGLLIEHYAGAFPYWLAPIQMQVIPVSEKVFDYACKVYTKLQEAGVRVDVDMSDDTLGKKIRNSEMQKIPYLLIVGQKEADLSGKELFVSVRSRQDGDLGQMEISKLLEKVK